MDNNPSPSSTPSRTSTPNPANSRFTAQSSTAEDLLKNQTVGLVHLSEFRKRRAEALEQKEREAQNRTLGKSTSGTATPDGDGASTPHQPPKKKRKPVAKGKLSFGVDDDDENENEVSSTPSSTTPDERASATPPQPPSETSASLKKKRLGPNASLSVAPKALTKSALLREAQTREQLRKEFLALQEAVKATEIVIPFVFYDGTNIPGGECRVKKGDFIWLFLDKARKVGAELGVGGAGEKANSRREWARVGIDDLMLVRGEIIIPHHYDFYYFIVNKTKDLNNAPLFDYSSQPTTTTTTTHTDPHSRSHSHSHSHSRSRSRSSSTAPPPPTTTTTTPLEGSTDDPTFTKVVDRRWYERNKHIFPASVWEDFDPAKDYTKGVKKDTEGNAFFFS
ncbi:MAG: hypothetical protein M1819_001382 [Sarea resinae]|nr:MAG: hypothetical protein M1819_001382 [Sarea resinae]